MNLKMLDHYLAAGEISSKGKKTPLNNEDRP